MELGHEMRSLLAEVATGGWRLRQRLGPSDGDLSAAECRRLRRDVEALWDVLMQAGIEVHDHCGARYEPGLGLQVLAVQPACGLDGERILETIKPTVYYRGEWLQTGEVVVGTPSIPISKG
jgi:hypothetical protein